MKAKETLFIAKFSYGKANLAKARLKKETPKTFIVEGREEDILGWQYIPTRLSKRKYHCFHSGKDAMAFLIAEAKTYIAVCEAKHQKAILEYNRLLEIQEGGNEPA